ncbi:MAG: Lrp/AsnC ligand binding domain-containing protein [Planctomycetota bacterium]|nr:Lrp/AsnC ligand binding domain-containing protein [Planctomycetota bacterium]
MAKAYVKVWVQPGMEKEVQRELLDVDEFMTADITAGEQDMICLVEAGSYDELLSTVMAKLRAMKGVTRTVTNLILEIE